VQDQPYPSVDLDAREYGDHVRYGGWRLGLLVARNVEKGNSNGRPPQEETATVVAVSSGKVSAKEFARRSGTSDMTALRYLDAWERAAEAGYVPRSADMVPGQDVQLPKDEDGELWRTFYRSQAGLHVTEERQKALEKEAKAQGVGPSKVRDIASNPNAMKAAIAADPKIASAAMEALSERHRRAVHAPQVSGDDDVVDPLPKLPSEDFWGPRQVVHRLHGAFLDIKRQARDWTPEQRQFAAGNLEAHRHTVGMIIDMLRGLDDSELAALLNGESQG
jgi:hypothetical protein